jgi:hypothetical protein
MRTSKTITDKKDIDYLLNLDINTLESLSFIMETFGEFNGKQRFNTYDIITIPENSYGPEKHKNKNKFVTTVGRFVKKFYDVYFEDELEYLFKGVLLKDLRINMGIKSFQKVWPDFCFTYPYLGCKPYSDKNLDRMTYPAIVQTKMDGLFCNAIVKVGDSVKYVSRQGKPMTIQGSLDNILLNMKFNEDFVLNGEN